MATRNRVGYAAVLVLLAFAAGLAGAFVHTDDGCAVERHCGACRTALVNTGTLPAVATVVPAVQPAEGLIPTRHSAALSAPLATDSNRGPPAAI